MAARQVWLSSCRTWGALTFWVIGAATADSAMAGQPAAHRAGVVSHTPTAGKSAAQPKAPAVHAAKARKAIKKKQPARVAMHPLAKGKEGGRGKSKRPGKLSSHSRKPPDRSPVLPPPRGRVAVFAFRGDDANSTSVQAQVVRSLRAQGLKVVTTLRPVDSAEQYREMAVALDLAVYVDGEIHDEGDDLASATIHVRSGVTGLRVASATFSGDRRRLPSDVKKTLWTEVGPAFSRVCADAAKPRKPARAPMRIEAGTPIESVPAAPPTEPEPAAAPARTAEKGT